MRRRRTTLIKSNNPHLAGGEKHYWKNNPQSEYLERNNLLISTLLLIAKGPLEWRCVEKALEWISYMACRINTNANNFNEVTSINPFCSC